MLLIASNGFLPTRGSWTLDGVFLAMFLIVFAMLVSVYLVRSKRLFQSHRRIQTVLAVVLGIAIAIFEIDMRFFTDWRELAKPSSFYESGSVDRSLIIHLVFAIPTPFVWIYVIYSAFTKFEKSETKQTIPGEHSANHRIWGRIAAGMMVMTAVTGWIFYWMAFVA